jgi:hypothetical protein
MEPNTNPLKFKQELVTVVIVMDGYSLEVVVVVTSNKDSSELVLLLFHYFST